jgi:hypothetical protein
MAFQKLNPASLAARRASKRNCVTAKFLLGESNALHLIQAQMIARRYGVRSHLAAVIAEHAFTSEARR